MLDTNLFDIRRPGNRPLRIEERLRPDAVFDLTWLVQCRVKILIVTDGSGGFSDTTGFHLGQIINILADDPWGHIRFEVTKAHREESGEEGVLDNFRFDAHDLKQYSQIWLFGITRKTGALSSSELRALSEFMDDEKGGVFATGDHENLGEAMSAEIPRVRSMRRWHYPNTGPNGEPIAPDRNGIKSHDTIVNFGMGGTQTDPEPQTISPVLYTRTLSAGPILNQVVRYPHPLLCGPNGVINYLPDHMHEGWCEVPKDLSKSWTFESKTFTEYRTKNGHQQRPEVIAYADNNHSNRQFGVIAAYDGHRVDVGRVVVDSTWHHWFNINTLPYINASNPAHPSYTPATVQKWEEIKAYYRNVAVWLARPTLQRCIRNGGWLRTLGDYDVIITAQNLEQVTDLSLYYWQLGTFALDALGRGATQCQTIQWVLDILYPIEFEPRLPFPVDPWIQLPPDNRPEAPPRSFDVKEFEAIALGAAIHEARQKFGQVKNPQALLDTDDGAELEEVLRGGVSHGINVYANQMEESFNMGQRLLSQMR